ncbi:hypothetical protein F511_20686 [Dorcoceras hygrometricum]|uniref:Uncharacterized protein n=1 Tax=Dorcoceras hygrometricum TaxID=472368 RepID=A0A2Z7BAJ4_9LAMI|nr:hypothetical protein F511_20686 [Dorcoceras hygrometricum]
MNRSLKIPSWFTSLEQEPVSEWTKRTSTVALDEKNIAKLVKDKPAQTEEDLLGEEKTGSGDLVKLDAYERDGRRYAEVVIMNNVDAYDDVKITCPPISKESWRKILVVKENSAHVLKMKKNLRPIKRQRTQNRAQAQKRICETKRVFVGIGPDPHPGRQRKNKILPGCDQYELWKQIYVSTYIGCLASHLSGTCAWLQPVFQEPGASRLIAVDSSIRYTTGLEAPSSDCTRSPDEISTIGSSTSNWPEQISGDDRRRATATAWRREGGGGD